MKFLIPVLFLAVFLSGCITTNVETLTVLVLDSENSEPISDASVTINSLEDSSLSRARGTTNAFGVFTVQLDSGTYVVTVQKNGYDSEETSLVVTANSVNERTFKLSMTDSAPPAEVEGIIDSTPPEEELSPIVEPIPTIVEPTPTIVETTPTIVETTPCVKSNAVKLIISSGKYNALRQSVFIIPEETYLLTGSIKTKLESGSCQMDVYGDKGNFDTDGTTLVEGVTDLTEYSEQFMIPNNIGVKQVQVRLLQTEPNTVGSCWFDDISLTRVNYPKVNHLVNPGFESSNDSLTSWSVFSGSTGTRQVATLSTGSC